MIKAFIELVKTETAGFLIWAILVSLSATLIIAAINLVVVHPAGG